MKFALILSVVGLSTALVAQESRPVSPYPDLNIPLKAHEPDKPIGFSLVVTPGGFTRREGSILDRGVYEIRIINRTGNKNLAIQLDRVSDGKTSAPMAPEASLLKPTGADDITRGKLRIVQKLEPGTYKLWATNFPRWTYILTVR